ncbi:MAG TPA: hypothetical protein VKM55_01400 [Candidatus Lokiarchaeia archaeon]|nr:hypothetical protein [Candidatus Lokiarchaeia archaeon]
MNDEKNDQAPSVEKIDQALEEVGNISSELQAAREQFQETLAKFDAINPIFTDLEKILQDNKATIEELDRERTLLEEEKQKKDEKISQMSSEQEEILQRYSEIEGELKKFTSLVQKYEGQELTFDDIKASLAIFTILVEKIFQGQPHARILYTLHGGASSMTRDQLKNATGIEGAMVLRAIHELARANLVDYNENTSTVKLLKRFY